MARRGPSPKPTKLKALAGNPGKRKLARNEPVPPDDKPVCPKWLSPAAVVEWKRIGPILDKMKLLSAADQVALAAYCQAAAELQLATEKIDAEGRYLDEAVVDRQGKPVEYGSGKSRRRLVRTKAHPALKAQRDAFARVRAFLQEFGLSPSARARIGDPNGNDGTDQLAPLILRMQRAGQAG